MYTALNALAELDKFPAFKRELALLLDHGVCLSLTEGVDQAKLCRIAETRLRRLGSMIVNRCEWDSTIEGMTNEQILDRAFHNDPKA